MSEEKRAEILQALAPGLQIYRETGGESRPLIDHVRAMISYYQRNEAHAMRTKCATILKDALDRERAYKKEASFAEWLKCDAIETVLIVLYEDICDLPLPGEHTDE